MYLYPYYGMVTINKQDILQKHYNLLITSAIWWALQMKIDR